MDTAEQHQRLAAKHKLWPFTVLEFQRAALGAMQGAVNMSNSGSEPAQLSKSIGGALSGAASGAMLGSAVPGIGTAAGAVGGGILGIASSFF